MESVGTRTTLSNPTFVRTDICCEVTLKPPEDMQHFVCCANEMGLSDH